MKYCLPIFYSQLFFPKKSSYEWRERLYKEYKAILSQKSVNRNISVWKFESTVPKPFGIMGPRRSIMHFSCDSEWLAWIESALVSLSWNRLSDRGGCSCWSRLSHPSCASSSSFLLWLFHSLPMLLLVPKIYNVSHIIEYISLEGHFQF